MVYIFGGRSERRGQIVLYYTSVFDFCDCIAVGSLKWGGIVGFPCLRLGKLRIGCLEIGIEIHIVILAFSLL